MLFSEAVRIAANASSSTNPQRRKINGRMAKGKVKISNRKKQRKVFTDNSLYLTDLVSAEKVKGANPDHFSRV